MVDGATHQAREYLDVRISFGLNGTVHNFHFLAIPTGNLAHTGQNYAELVLNTIRAVAGDRVLLKLIGIATDGAATMVGCRRGFVKRIKDACIAVGGGGIVANWCGSHQLNLVVDAFLNVLDDYVDFRSKLGREIAFTRTHETVKHSLGNCPTYSTTRWDSIYYSSKFLTAIYIDLVRFQREKKRAMSSPTWWLCLFLVADLARSIKLCFAKLQYKNVTILEQYNAIQALVRTCRSRFEETGPDGSPVLSEVKIEAELCYAAAFSRQIYQELNLDEQQDRVLAVLSAIERFIDGAETITLTIGQDTTIIVDLTTPKAIIDSTDDDFTAVLNRHQDRLTHQYGGVVISSIWDQRKLLREEFDDCRSFQNTVVQVSNLPVNDAWAESDFDRRFGDLKTFALGLASIPPGTHTVESDFSTLKRVKMPIRSRLSDFSMEGELHAQQYFELVSLSGSSIQEASV